MARKRRRNSLAWFAVAAFAGVSQPAMAAIIGTCTIVVGASGTMTANPAIGMLSSKQAGGSSASATIVASSLLCTLLNLLDCYSVSAPAPAAFSSAPSGGGTNVTFASVFRLDGSAVDINGSVPQRVTNGTHALQVDLTATKSSGVFPAGTYQGIVTVLCE
ncbi:hypothetical protein C1D09_006035 [Mesorhizobium intechi]|uniref:Spore coat protein U domain-containing protein n=1 Tax=Mesorhizobium intechi TaxID=537601 RepID=A0A8T9AW45_9HYPH|nr:hypothetical protein [Mesorhizobium intechi]TSE13095.1 hypothetical protein C1D09_006035 [Mesorhizobium intechi]